MKNDFMIIDDENIILNMSYEEINWICFCLREYDKKLCNYSEEFIDDYCYLTEEILEYFYEVLKSRVKHKKGRVE